ncbi:MAG: hypothetical protein U0446_09925 [Dehalococcoidia bacterium]
MDYVATGHLPDARIQRVFMLLASAEAHTPEGIDRVRRAVAEAENEIDDQIDALEKWRRVLESISDSLDGDEAPRARVPEQRPSGAATRAAALRSSRSLTLAQEAAQQTGTAITSEIANVLRREGDEAGKLETAVGNILSHAGWRRIGTGVYVPPEKADQPRREHDDTDVEVPMAS